MVGGRKSSKSLVKYRCEEIVYLDAERDEGSGTPLIIQLYCNINNPLPILMSALLMIHPRATEVEEPTAQMGSTSFVGG